MKNVRIFALTLSLLLVATDSPAPVQGNNNCPPDMDAGALICRSTCYSSNSCRVSNENPVGSYCWIAYSVSGTSTLACHQGVYDPCCDPNYQW